MAHVCRLSIPLFAYYAFILILKHFDRQIEIRTLFSTSNYLLTLFTWNPEGKMEERFWPSIIRRMEWTRYQLWLCLFPLYGEKMRTKWVDNCFAMKDNL